MTQVSFKGVFPIAITPFGSDEHIDLESFRRIIRFMASLGVDGVTILGVLGESNRLIDKEREALIQTAVAAAGTLPIIVGTSHSGTRATCDLSQMAEGLGAAGVMVTPSREAVPNPDRVFEYFQRVAASIDALFTNLCKGEAAPQTLRLRGRELQVASAGVRTAVARFSFDALCGRPLGAEDYLGLAQAFHTVIVEASESWSSAVGVSGGGTFDSTEMDSG